MHCPPPQRMSHSLMQPYGALWSLTELYGALRILTEPHRASRKRADFYTALHSQAGRHRVEWAIHLAEEHDSEVLLLHAYHRTKKALSRTLRASYITIVEHIELQ